jgi:filamentous hemagglutinin
VAGSAAGTAAHGGAQFATAATEPVEATVAQPELRNFVKPKALLSTEAQSFLQATESPFKGQGLLTNAGRATTKHPEYFGFNSTKELRSIYRTDEQLNTLANTHAQEILSNGIRTTGAGGRYPGGWVTYTLPDGRAASWTTSGEFIGFRGLQK